MSKKKKISVSVARRSISEEKYTIFKDGKFNPDCPDSFNFLTGTVTVKPWDNKRNIYLPDYHSNNLPTEYIY